MIYNYYFSPIKASIGFENIAGSNILSDIEIFSKSAILLGV